MRISYIHNELLKKGIDSYSSWLGKGGGPYMICRPFNSKSKKAKAYLIPIDDDQDDKFVEAILEDLTPLNPTRRRNGHI